MNPIMIYLVCVHQLDIFLRSGQQVEQLHKIFKFCGSPPEEFWKRCKLPHATMFKPHHPYPSTLREKCIDFPPCVVNLIETFLSVEPDKRGTASSALMSSVYFSHLNCNFLVARKQLMQFYILHLLCPICIFLKLKILWKEESIIYISMKSCYFHIVQH